MELSEKELKICLSALECKEGETLLNKNENILFNKLKKHFNVKKCIFFDQTHYKNHPFVKINTGFNGMSISYYIDCNKDGRKCDTCEFYVNDYLV